VPDVCGCMSGRGKHLLKLGNPFSLVKGTAITSKCRQIDIRSALISWSVLFDR